MAKAAKLKQTGTPVTLSGDLVRIARSALDKLVVRGTIAVAGSNLDTAVIMRRNLAGVPVRIGLIGRADLEAMSEAGFLEKIRESKKEKTKMSLHQVTEMGRKFHASH